jgi:hypothetical protein
MRRRLTALIAAGVLAASAGIGLAGCGGDDDDNDVAPAEIDDTTGTTDEATTEENVGRY